VHGHKGTRNARQRSLKIGRRICDHRIAIGGVAIAVTIGIDDQAAHLWPQSVDDPFDQRTSSELQQSFVLTTHAASLASS